MAQTVLPALPAGARRGQLRLARRRQPGGDALHRSPSHRDRRGVAARHPRTRPSTSATTTTPRCASRWCCRRPFRSCSSTAAPASPSAWRPTFPPHNLSEIVAALVALIDDPDLDNKESVQVHQGPGLPDRRRDPQLARRAARDLRDRPGRRPAARAVRQRRRETAAAASSSRSIPYTTNKARIVEEIAEHIIARRCRRPSTSATSRPTSCASSSRSSPTPRRTP